MKSRYNLLASHLSILRWYFVFGVDDRLSEKSLSHIQYSTKEELSDLMPVNALRQVECQFRPKRKQIPEQTQ